MSGLAFLFVNLTLHTLIHTFALSDAPTLSRCNPKTLFIFQKPCGASAPLFYCGFNATRGIEECLKEHGINWREEGEKD